MNGQSTRVRAGNQRRWLPWRKGGEMLAPGFPSLGYPGGFFRTRDQADTLPSPNTDMITNPAWIRVALALQQLSSALCPPPLPQMASPEEQNRWYLPGAGYKNQGHSDAQVPFIPDEVRAHSHRKSLFNINVTSHMRWTQASHTMSLGI